MWTHVCMRSDMLRIHLPVLTERSPISSKAGSGASVNSAGRSFVSVRQARPGLPLMSIAHEPQMPARQTKSNCSVGSWLSRRSFRAMKSVIESDSSSSYVCMCGTLSGSCGL